MKYYVTADIHGYFSIMRKALAASGFYDDTEPHKLIILGDLFDRGKEACKLQDFVLDLMEKDGIILIRGNHEDLFESLVTEDQGRPLDHHVHNGTFDTALQLTGYDMVMAGLRNFDFADAAKQTPYYQRIIPSMLDYYETEHYVFVHGWIPCIYDWGNYCYIEDWRSAGPGEWREARWSNGIDAAQSCLEKKTVLCGHWHASYGHAVYEGRGSEFGPDADFSPYTGPGVIALDACTAHSGAVNVITLDD
ncbi:MAG: metallophosphoesterase [Oscillospiraceae bacterium]|nr:metallophosphoesterase [Oscillospiraceae bacterium]